MTIEEMEISRYKSMIVAVSKAIENPSKKASRKNLLLDAILLEKLKKQLKNLENI